MALLRSMLRSGAVAGFALVLGSQQAGAEITLSGAATFEFAQSTGTGDPQKLELRLEPELTADLPGGWSFTGISRLRADVYDRLVPGAPDPDEMSNLSRTVLIGDRVELELREFQLVAAQIERETSRSTALPSGESFLAQSAARRVITGRVRGTGGKPKRGTAKQQAKKSKAATTAASV